MPKAPTWQELDERFLSRIEINAAGCWIWTGTHANKPLDYGYFWDGTRTVRAHRYSYEMFVGPIPIELQIDHLCRVPRCVCPLHLEPVTQSENMLRSYAARPDRPCVKCGVMMTYTKSGRRRCETCETTHKRRYNKKQRRITEHLQAWLIGCDGSAWEFRVMDVLNNVDCKHAVTSPYGPTRWATRKAADLARAAHRESCVDPR